LNTAVGKEDWSACDLRPAIDWALDQFGVEHLMFGSDWPVCVLAGDYARVWDETRSALAHLTEAEQDALLGGSATRIYRI
jgi:L-fuconolactonase